jgi:hypothetical protein
VKPKKMKYGYLWVTLTLFVLALGGQAVFGWWAYVDDAHAHGQPVALAKYAIQFARATFENWQAEFMSILWQVVGLAFLWCVGSPQSKEGEDRLEKKVDFLMAQIEGGHALQELLDNEYPRK